MKKKLKKIIAAVTLCAFSLGVAAPVYASTAMNPTQDFEEIEIKYDENGYIREELCRLGDVYYYRVVEGEKVTVITLSQENGAKIITNDLQVENCVKSATVDLPENSLLTSQKNIKQTAIQIYKLIDDNTIDFVEKSLTSSEPQLYGLSAVPSDHKEAITSTAMTMWNSPAECTDQFITSKSTTNVRASLYYSVEHEVDETESAKLEAGITLAEILVKFVNIPAAILRTILSFTEEAGDLILQEDTDLYEYDFRAIETKSVKCDGHVDYTAQKIQRLVAVVTETPNGPDAILTSERISTDSLFNNNSALLDAGIEYHQYNC